MASDWVCWLDEKKPMWDHRWWDVYGNVCRKLGLQWGGDFISFRDRPHNNLSLKCTWKDVNGVRLAKGYDAAILYIKDNLI
jgi:hypothetical protein